MWSWVAALGKGEAPVDAESVQSTIDPVRTDDGAEAISRPESEQAVETDPSGQLTGLTHRQVAGYVEPTRRYIPWQALLATADYASPINAQVATSGTAAAREAAGQWGHGTIQAVESIEPTLTSEREYGQDYFTTNARQIQDGIRSDMSPEVVDREGIAASGASSATAMRAASTASRWDVLL